MTRGVPGDGFAAILGAASRRFVKIRTSVSTARPSHGAFSVIPPRQRRRELTPCGALRRRVQRSLVAHRSQAVSPRKRTVGHHDQVTLDELTAAMRRFDDAVQQRDHDAAEEVLDEDYALVLVHPSAALMPRARWLQVLDDYVVHSYVVEEQHVDQIDDVATVLSRVRMQATVLGEDRSGMFVITDVWRRRDGGWRVWRRHSSPLSAGDLPGASNS